MRIVKIYIIIIIQWSYNSIKVYNNNIIARDSIFDLKHVSLPSSKTIKFMYQVVPSILPIYYYYMSICATEKEKNIVKK